jgi:hypothetical protein
MAHVLKRKGDIGVAKVIADATSQGWNVCVPLTEHASYDLIVEKDGQSERMQVRYTSARKGRLEVKLRSSWADKNGTHCRKRKLEDFDILGVYCPEQDEVFYLRAKTFQNSTSINLRLEPTRTKQTKIRMAEQFRKL